MSHTRLASHSHMTEAEEHTAESGTAEAHTQCVCDH